MHVLIGECNATGAPVCAGVRRCLNQACCEGALNKNAEMRCAGVHLRSRASKVLLRQAWIRAEVAKDPRWLFQPPKVLVELARNAGHCVGRNAIRRDLVQLGLLPLAERAIDDSAERAERAAPSLDVRSPGV